MPYPVYIICSEGGAIDKVTNTVSIFGVIETIRFMHAEKPIPLSDLPKGNPFLHIRMTAAWKRDEAEAETTFEHETLLWLPGNEQPQKVLDGSFVFKHKLHRFVAEMRITGLDKEGTIRVQNRIREFGQEQWLDHTYEIPVERMTLSNKPSSDG